MKFTKKLVVALLVLALTFALSPGAAFTDGNIRVAVDGRQLVFADQVPVIVESRTLIPLREVFEFLGFEVEWCQTDQRVTLTRYDTTVVLTIGSGIFAINGVSRTLDVSAQIISGRTMLPLRAVLESVGYGLSWDDESRVVGIFSQPGAPIIESGQIRIGVTRPSFDNVGQILRVFGEAVELYTLSANDLRSIENLQEFYAIFINCGSHDDIEASVLNDFVSRGGIVYASDHASDVLRYAFPEVVEFNKGNPSQVISNADIVHSTLAAHMRIDDLDVLFNMSGWHSITALSDSATVYIEGELLGGEIMPLAVSFDYGRGRVFYTSFHNSAQATFHIINFIEYLVFRILNVQADRTLQEAAERDGFVYRGAVFGGAGAAAGALASSPPAADSEGQAEGTLEMPSPEGPPSPTQNIASPAPPALQDEYFRYTFSGQGFMLMFSAGSEFYYVTLVDPNGNRFIIDSDGTVSIGDLSDPGALVPVITLGYSDGYRVRVMNITPGQWRFTAQPRNGDDIMIGIAVME
ncbi:MAG: copper amine oxidase N-terminal domain-containing protein [Oscillospiraceae bacterium]|nr:copper amine oxidase N-terminal domain-containing protein [Oscillospiraceae bacterium]